MKRYSANVWETLIEALHVYWQVVKEKWLALLAVIVPVQLLMALYWYSTASSGAENLANVRFENVIGAVLGLTIGLAAVAIAIDSAFFKCAGQRRPAGDRIVEAWGRMMATGLLRWIAEIALGFLVIIALVIVVMVASSAPLTQVGGSASAFSVIIACIILAPLVVALVWILMRWGFAIVLSAIHPIMGSTAMGESWRFVRGRFASCFFLVVAAWLVMSGISAIPDLLAAWYARGKMIGMAPPSGSIFARAVVLFIGGMFTSFASFFFAVAMTIFWVRTVEPCDLPESVRRGPARLLIVVLLALGVIHYAIAGCFGAKAALRAKEEMDQQRAAQRAELLKLRAFGSLREESVAVHSLPDAYKEEHMRMEDGELVVDSPFDLCIGSTECAKLLGAKLNSSTFGTNQYHFACARLAKPYFGCKWLSLNFRGAEHALGSIYLGNDNPTLDDCRKTVRGIADDIGQRFGVKMEPTLDITDEQALDRNKRLRPRSDNSRCLCEFLTYQARMDNGHEIVQYCVNGMVDSKTKTLSARLSIRAEGK